MSQAFLTTLCIFTMSLNLVAIVSMWARTHQLDVPNARSSHTTPTPRGGGIAIVLASLAGALVLWWNGQLADGLALAIVCGGAGIALVGHIDDRRNIATLPRLVIHIAAAAFALWCIGGVAALPVGTYIWHPGSIGWLIALVGLVWMINLTNFMDGIDGLVGSHTIFVSLAGAALLWATATPGGAAFMVLLAAATAGFLVFNWPPASIFMGDVSSGFLGFVIGAVAIATAEHVNLWAWGLLLTPFIADATITRAMRIVRYGDWVGAHRSHVYQRLSRRWSGHAPVVHTYWLISLIVFWPLALLVTLHPAVGWVVMPAAWGISFAAAFALGAGRDDEAA